MNWDIIWGKKQDVPFYQNWTFKTLGIAFGLFLLILLIYLWSRRSVQSSCVRQPTPEITKAEVFNVKDNLYTYGEAQGVCEKYGSRLAKMEELEQAQKHGANWCNLGWIADQSAYYPIQPEQMKIVKKWSSQFHDACGQVGLNGGRYPTQLKLSVTCFGTKPKDTKHLNPFNTVSNQWSQFGI